MKVKIASLLFLLATGTAFSAGNVIVKWDLDARFRDVLEFQTELGGEWGVVIPPYGFSVESDGTLDYHIIVPKGDAPRKFFRVARTWGEPLLDLQTHNRSSSPSDAGEQTTKP